MPPSSAQAYQQLTDFNKNRRTSQSYMDEANNKYNIGGLTSRLNNLRTLTGNLETSVEQVDPSVTGRTSGSLVTEAQRSALVSRERAPILGDLAKQQQALGQGQQEFSLASQLAGDYAGKLSQDDDTTYQRLFGGYQAATAAEQAAEQKRQYEADMAEKKRQFDLSLKASSGGGSLGGLFGGGAVPAGGGGASKTDPLQQTAYNDVRTRIQNQDDRGLMSDYQATAASAKNGNAKDLLKLQFYRQLRPDLFKSAYSWEKNGGQKTVTINSGSGSRGASGGW